VVARVQVVAEVVAGVTLLRQTLRAVQVRLVVAMVAVELAVVTQTTLGVTAAMVLKAR